jgi:hypothetical protein
MLPLISTAALLAGLAIATAQTAPAPTPAEQATIPQAPVGHRQPRAADVPPPPPISEAERRENERIHRLLQSICRGC